MNNEELEILLDKQIKHSKIKIIGISVLKRPIYSVFFDFKSNRTVIIQGGIHAREHITADVLMKMVFEVSNNYEKLLKKKTPNIVFVPLLNPDGAELVISGLKSVKDSRTKRFLRQINNGSSDFSLFKANANGVDLNSNFDARWGTGKENLFFPSPQGFVGEKPMSEPCVQAIALLTEKTKPFFTISYHCKGEEVYYDFFCKKEHKKRDRRIAKIVSRTLKYKIKSTQNSSSGGFKDWCISKFQIPSVTIEVGADKLSHPIGKEWALKIFKRNRKLLYKLNKIAKEYEKYARKTKVYEKGACTCKKSV